MADQRKIRIVQENIEELARVRDVRIGINTRSHDFLVVLPDQSTRGRLVSAILTAPDLQALGVAAIQAAAGRYDYSQELPDPSTVITTAPARGGE